MKGACIPKWLVIIAAGSYIAFGLLGPQQFDPFMSCDAFGMNCRVTGDALWVF